MPGLDGTGPLGSGMRARELKSNRAGNAQGFGVGCRFPRGQMQGKPGFGRGCSKGGFQGCFKGVATHPNKPQGRRFCQGGIGSLNSLDELSVLKSQADFFESNLEKLKNRISKMEA